MHFLIFIPHYVHWHYSRGLNEFLINALSVTKFVFNFFSIPLLLRTLFSPWERMGEKYKKGVDLTSWLETFVLNSILRFLGFFLRTIIILFGLVSLIFISVLCIFIFLIWLTMPIFLLFLISLALIEMV